MDLHVHVYHNIKILMCKRLPCTYMEHSSKYMHDCTCIRKLLTITLNIFIVTAFRMRSSICLLIMALTLSAVKGIPLYRPPLENMDETKLDSHYDSNDYGGADKAITGDISYFTWLRHLLAGHKLQPASVEKRFAGMSMPYFKYQKNKRNNGIWIWMPAQGYVSVPQQEHSLVAGGDAGEAPGKVMRYGR